jgi:hypothetical protein
MSRRRKHAMGSKAISAIKQTLLIGACSLALGAPLLAHPARGQAGSGLLDCRQMHPGQFETLPDAQRLICGSEETTAGEIRREWHDKRQRVQAQARQAQAEAQATLDALQKEYGPKVSLEEAEARMRAELAKLKQPDAVSAATKEQFAKIRQEAVQLQERSQAARTPQERVQIQARAKELLDHLHRMGNDWDQHRYLYFHICQVVDCGALLGIPRIDAVLPFSVVSPNGPIIIGGEHFGTVKGTLWLKGSFGSRKMIIDTWGDGGVGAFFPSAAATGQISDVHLTLQVETSSGLKSNDWPLQWVQEVTLLDTGSVSVHNCGKDANVNSCNWELYVGAGCFSFSHTTDMILASKPPDPHCPCTAVGFHGNCWGAVGDDFGSDVYEIGPLKNAWALLTFAFADSLPKVDSCDDAVKPLGFQGGASWAPEVHWCVTPNDELFYWLWVYIIGPKGFPHK